ncbi:MAG: hypothetical protein JW774_08600 [Candidatus Aureabacteria bacterium]|nr:hypothetical protein [Candidatus Auribacterota bacterium]
MKIRQHQSIKTSSILQNRTQFFGGTALRIAHELNQPLFGIRGLAEHLLLSIKKGWDLDPGKIRDHAEEIIHQIDRITSILKPVQKISKEAQTTDLSPVSVNEAILLSIELLKNRMNKKRIGYHLYLKEDLPLIWGHFFDLCEIFLVLQAAFLDLYEVKMEKIEGIDPPSLVITTGLNNSDLDFPIAVTYDYQGVSNIFTENNFIENSPFFQTIPTLLDRLNGRMTHKKKEKGRQVIIYLPTVKLIKEAT